ncbi:serine/threonine-protein kinase [Nocardia jejuensis]|uniref:serine/threonine-protein kinase n=1 Tax=Nocardia jejuensis TaxID=328049 RepID=UPI00083252CD|nr:serine/threonine-protein kinase [Nocardia jejuensis]
MQLGLVAGAVFAGHRIERVLGRGGMGTVYLAQHPRLPRLIALKLLNRDVQGEEDVQRRFAREADVAARLDHPNIVAVLDRGVEDGQLWIAMQYVDGSDAAAFGGSALDPVRAARIIGQTAEALDYAHERGVLHRDVKPANILLTAGRGGDRVLLSDFGIARLLDDQNQLTKTGDLRATLAYAAPEQLSGAIVDHRVDQYALGCTLFALLTGQAPFPATDPGAMVVAHLTHPVRAVSAMVPGLPVAIDAVIARAMAKTPDERYSSCSEFAEAAVEALDRPATERLPPQGIPRAPVGAWSNESAHPADSSMRAEPVPHASPRSDATTRSAVTVRSGPVPSHPRSTQGSGAHLGNNLGEEIADNRDEFTDRSARDASQRSAGDPVGPTYDSRQPGWTSEATRAASVRPDAVSRRWRTVSVLLIVLALLAVATVGAAGVYWKYLRPRPEAMPWGAHQSIAALLPQLIPANPAGAGWRGAQCSAVGMVVVQPGDPVPERQIMCTDSDGLIAWYTRYSRAQDVQGYLDARAARVSEREFSTAGNLGLYRPTGAGSPFTLAGYSTAPAFDQTLIEISWPGHTFDETRDQWWQVAPI